MCHRQPKPENLRKGLIVLKFASPSGGLMGMGRPRSRRPRRPGQDATFYRKMTRLGIVSPDRREMLT
jgi:hypothetical protein